MIIDCTVRRAKPRVGFPDFSTRWRLENRWAIETLLNPMDDQSKSRVRELMFYVVPDPDEVIDEYVLARSEAVGFEEGQRLKAEFRSLIESLDDWPIVREIVLNALNDMDASSDEATGDDVEWMNVRDVMGRRIRKVLEPVLSAH